ncbi:ParB/RepB/Spo0J family partition protein [Crossiella cryophila]|uniref:ParB-like N-terminal domain-containing protein n=1 Tax=Crossiella cryophila TaxID=43355 RepID=A0A7W7CBN9_9PSEU|nr:ParB/RepB/Spo0J family partition protein [Crossiella cryophila]MBB4678179.1 hypothetical protein [Crossiella cryophila]
MAHQSGPRRPSKGVSAAPVLVDIALLRTTGSPRRSGEHPGHSRVLAEFRSLPPILVHRQTMTVIDGVHRLRAAVRNGHTRIRVQFFDGDEETAFLLGVKANSALGLPLDLAERSHAAARILRSCPQWTNKAIASAVGLAPDTVARLRAAPSARSAPGEPDLAADLLALRADAELSATAQGRVLVRWLGFGAAFARNWPALLAGVPAHSARLVARMARACADSLRCFADELDRR